MSCFCDCTRENTKEDKIRTVTPNSVVRVSNSISSKRGSNFDMYMTKKISHSLPTIKESLDEEDEFKTRRAKGGKEIQKKLPIILDKSSKKQFYDFKEQVICFFCGGESCKHENWKLHPNPAIIGLNSDRITNDIFASQRLSNRIIHEYDLIKTFKELKIGLIINLQREGEHPYCGDKLDINSGFSYDPQILLSEDIKYQNFGWEDMSIPDSMGFMINVMKEMLITIKEEKKKVLIHCHAGYGRTGIVIACYMILDSNKSAEEVVTEIRSKRPKCIQKTSQMEYCKQFREFIDFNRCIYTTQIQSIDYYLKNQNNLLYGNEAKKYKNIPKIFVVLTERLILLKKELSIENSKIYQDLYFLEFWDEELENKICEIKKEINKWNWNVINECKELPILIQLFYDWIGDCVISVIPAQKIISIFEKISEEEFKIDSENPTKKNICLNLKTILKTNEFECLVYITKLVINILPTNQNDVKLFNKVLEKLLLVITGINPRKIYYRYGEKNENVPQEILELFNKFNILINFLASVLKYDYMSDSEAFLQEILYNSGIYVNKANTMINGINLFKSDKLQIQRTMLSALEDDRSFDMKNMRKYTFNNEDPKERDKNMYYIFQMLNHYFSSNNTFLEEDPNVFEKEINSSIYEYKEDQKVNQTNNKIFIKSKSIKNENEIFDLKKTMNIDSNEMILDIFEQFQNFLKTQNFLKNNSNKLSCDNSLDISFKFPKNQAKSQIKKKDMQIIEEDPNENRFSRGFSKVSNNIERQLSEKKEVVKNVAETQIFNLHNNQDQIEQKIREERIEIRENNIIPVSSARLILPKINDNRKFQKENKSIFGYKFFKSSNLTEDQSLNK